MKTETHRLQHQSVLQGIQRMEESGWAVRCISHYNYSGVTFFLVVFEKERQW